MFIFIYATTMVEHTHFHNNVDGFFEHMRAQQPEPVPGPISLAAAPGNKTSSPGPSFVHHFIPLLYSYNQGGYQVNVLKTFECILLQILSPSAFSLSMSYVLSFVCFVGSTFLCYVQSLVSVMCSL